MREKEKPQDRPGGNYNTFTMMRSIRARACCFAALLQLLENMAK
jgi:hypothetical protein